MKRIVTIALSIAAALIATGSAFAQDQTVKATVPFNFSVGSNWVPAGTYTIRLVNHDGILLRLSNREQKVNMMVMGQVDTNGTAEKGRMTFHKYGDRYFLSGIRYPNSAIEAHFAPSRTEKRAKEGTLEGSLRSNDNVLIALK